MFSDWEAKPAVGIAIAVISSFINGSTFVLQKKGILRSRQRGVSYLKDAVWWSGTLSMVVGQIGNFLAYNAAPAVIVAPLGALGVLFGAVLASRILEERLNTLGKLGCVLCCCGSAALVLHAPASQSVTTARQLEAGLADPVFVTYAVLVALTLAALMGRTAPASGRPDVGTYAAICSLLGCFTVPCSKGLGVAARDLLSGGPSVALFLGLLATLGAGVLLQLFYINKALEAFGSHVFEAVYYAAFTAAAPVSSALLFGEWTAPTAADWAAGLCGWVTACVGVAMLRLSQETSLVWKQTKKTA
ncbi:magnesium transporter NIPA1 isoform X3 [Syngnathoides biaculeatus]|uniref:magnesium transporter NIPA1 isoform X3 n=1 Tax=Syngnathoides biaculeatus TaxID=300417 RepID=UPI002ADDA7FA|nr:magnesium transporter NIPA1 isoform X3 [Syngnathoides biaculeatus]